RDWCGRTDTHLTLTPVIDLTEHVSVDRYEVGDRLRTRVSLHTMMCVFPWCTRPARSCDADHVIAHGDGGATCECNLAPLCRRHHRLKTKAGWRYTTVETGVWLWSEPHGQQFLRDQRGTLDVTPPGRHATTSNGCRAGPAQPAPRKSPTRIGTQPSRPLA
ncbi:MAG: HNH endonuclease signature motif containing protein, partial [Nocardioides sp.]